MRTSSSKPWSIHLFSGSWSLVNHSTCNRRFPYKVNLLVFSPLPLYRFNPRASNLSPTLATHLASSPPSPFNLSPPLRLHHRATARSRRIFRRNRLASFRTPTLQPYLPSPPRVSNRRSRRWASSYILWLNSNLSRRASCNLKQQARILSARA